MGTHRSIGPIEIIGFEPGGTPRALLIFGRVDRAPLLVDEGCPRKLSERSLKLVRKIVAGWDWAKFKSPVATAISARMRGRGEDTAAEVLQVLAKVGCAPIHGVQMRAADLLLKTDE